jgi:hypothetical protein
MKDAAHFRALAKRIERQSKLGKSEQSGQIFERRCCPRRRRRPFDLYIEHVDKRPAR